MAATSPVVEAIAAAFPKAQPALEFIARTHGLLAPYGFTPTNTLPLVATCRDELAFALTSQLQQVWGPAFNMAGLGGMLVLGYTGIAAASSHGPVDGGRRRFVLVALTHIGIDRQGTLGNCERPGVPGVSHTCGALMAVHDSLLGGGVRTSDYPYLDIVDPEQSQLRERIVGRLHPDEDPPDLAGITRVARDVIRDDSAGVVEVLRDASAEPADVAVFTGIQINGPDGNEYIEPGRCYLETADETIELSTH